MFPVHMFPLQKSFSGAGKVGVLVGGITLAGILGLPSLAQPVVSEIRISSGFTPSQAQVDGVTTGVYGISNLASRDRNGNLCLGYAEATPDHVLVLTDAFEHLNIAVDSDGSDTTLLIQGPNDETIRCNDNADRRSQDAAIDDIDWAAGTYRIWVGSFDQGTQHDYVLTVNP
jgi:hypothetical protein